MKNLLLQLSACLVTCQAYPIIPVEEERETPEGRYQDEYQKEVQIPTTTNIKEDLPALNKDGSNKVKTALESTLEIIFGNIDKDQYSKLFDKQNKSKESSRHKSNDLENVENKFNIQYGMLTPKSVQPEKLRTCCCSKERLSRKISYRLKKSQFQEQHDDLSEDTFICSCKCFQKSNGRHIRNILDDLTKKKLKISARL